MKQFFIQKASWTVTFLLSALLTFCCLEARSQVLLSEDFSSGSLPTGWSAVDESLSGVNWQFDNPGGWSITGGDPGFDDHFAILDSDYYGGSEVYEFSYLETAEFDASAPGMYYLSFDNSFLGYDDGTYFNGDGFVEVWDGTAWVEVLWLPYNIDDGYPIANSKSLDITDIVAGVSNAKVRFYWALGNWGLYWAIDNVLIERADECEAAEGIATRVADCDNSTFEVEIELLTMGDAASLELTDGVTTITATGIGTYTFGPYAFGELVEVLVIHPSSEYCDLTSGLITLEDCPATNDECVDAIELPVNAGATCVTSISGTTYFASPSTEALPSCLVSTLVDDVWFTFTAAEEMHGIDVSWISGVMDYQIAVYSGDCAGVLTEVACFPYGGSVTDLTPGEEYYVRLWSEFGMVGEYLEFDICVTTPIEGSLCTDPIEVSTLPYTHSSSTSTYGDFLGAEVPGSSSFCGTDFDYLSGDDVVYAFTASETTSIDIVASDLSDEYAGMFVYEACGDIGVNCAAGAYNFDETDDLSILDFPVVAGNTYYIVISTWAIPQSTDYTLTITSDEEPCVVPDVVVADQTICAGTSATLEASSTDASATFEWFDEEVGGTSLGTGTTYETVALTATDTFWIVATSDTCSTERLPVVVTVEELDLTAADATICSGTAASLEAIASIGTAEINWYDMATGGTLLHTGAIYTTDVLMASTVFYVEATTATCTTGRIPVTVTVEELTIVADDEVACLGGEAILTATSSSATALIEWFDVPTGGVALGTGSSFTTDPITTSPTTFYVQASEDGCVSERIPVMVTLIPEVDVLADGVAICADASVELTASSSVAGADFAWYDDPDATGAIAFGSVFTTPVITATTSYWVEAQSGVCSSERLEVVVSYGSGTAPDVSALATRICISGTSTVVASSSSGGATFSWYDAPTGGTPFFVGSTFVTPELTESTDYWVEAEVGGCVSERLLVTVVYINPIVTANDTTICYNSSANILASSIPSGIIRWYEDETSTTVIHTGATFTTPLLTDTTTYWVGSTVHGCPSPRVPVTVNVLPEIDIATSDVVSCIEGPVTLTASSSSTGAVIEWYDVAVGGTPLATGDTFETPTLTGPTVYYVQATLGDCASERLPVNVSAGSPPDVTGTSATICLSGTATLTASSTTSGVTFSWYEDEEGGTVLATGATFVTPEISDTTVYYVEANLGGCISERVAVSANVLNPTVTVILDTICESGSVMLFASPDIGGSIVRWYDSPTGPHIHSGTAFTTPVLTSTTTFYVTATVAGCVGERMPVTVEVVQPPVLDFTFDSVCVEGSGNIAVTSESDTLGVVYQWFDAPVDGTLLATGSTFETPSISTTTTFFVETSIGECVFTRTPVTMVVNNPQPIVADAYHCGEGNVTFTATGPADAIFRWYNTATSTEVLAIGAEFNTGVLSTTRDYYVTAEVDGCEGARLAVTAEIRPIPSISGSDSDICGPGSGTLTASSDAGTATFEWFEDMTSTIPVGAGAAFVTPVVTETTIFYVEAVDNGCVSERIPVTLNVNPVPTAFAEATEVCIEGTSTLTVTSDLEGATFTWYEDAAGSTVVGTGASYTTPSLTVNTTYYVTATLGDCTSELTAIEVIVNNPTMTSTDVVLCDPGSATLTAISAEPDATIEWYTSETGGTPIFVGGIFTTPELSETTTYYVSGTFAGCISPRIPVVVTVRNYDFEIIEGAVCEMGTVTLTASVDDATAVMEWYEDEELTTLVHTGTSFTTPVLSATTTYYVIAVTPECSTNPRAVVATVNPLPFLTVDPTMALTCPGDSVTFTAFEDSDYTYLWSDGTTSAEMTTSEYGNHTVVVTDENGCQSSMTVFLDTVVSPTVEGFDYIPLIFTNPYLYSFSPVGAEHATGYYWDFGDGNNSDLENPDHEYAAFGTYEVKLTVYNECDTAVISLPIYVHPTNSLDDDELNNQISVYPNPAMQHLNIELDGNDRINKVIVYNQLGQMMMSEQVDQLNKYTLVVDRLAQGSYMLIIETQANKKAVKKFVVQ